MTTPPDSLRIALLTSIGPTLDAFFPGLISEWRRAGHVVVSAAGTESERIPDSEVIKGLTRRPSLRTAQAPKALRTWVRRTDCDVVLVNTATASAVARGAGLAKPVVYFCHGLHWNAETGLSSLPWKVVERSLLSRTAGIITLNQFDETWFARARVTVPLLRLQFGVGLDLARYPASDLPGGRTLTIAWLGELSRRKNPLAAIEVLQELVVAGIPVHMHMAGTGPMEPEVRDRINDRGLAAYITMHGHTDVLPVLEASHIVLHTAAWEGFPRVLLEATAVGRATYAFDVKGVGDVSGARLARLGDTAGLAARIARDWGRGAIAPTMTPPRELMGDTRAAEKIADFLKVIVNNV